MFYLKMLVLILLFVMTLVQLFAIGGNFLEAWSNKSTTYAPTSLVKGKVIEVILPTKKEEAENEFMIPPFLGKVVVEYKDPSGLMKKTEFARANSVGPTVYFNNKVGDEVELEVQDPKGRASSAEKYLWRNTSGLFAGFAGLLLLAAAILRFL